MSLTVVSGPMFAGKSTWIQNYVHRNDKIGLVGIVLRPAHTARFSKERSGHMTTHDEVSTIECLDVPEGSTLLQFLDDKNSHQHNLDDRLATGDLSYVVVDEAQFCTGLLRFIERVVDTYHIDVVLVGLSSDYRRRPFLDAVSGDPEFVVAMALADKHVQLTALCTYCRDGSPAIFTQRKHVNTSTQNAQDSIVQIGASDAYESVCRKHFQSFVN